MKVPANLIRAGNIIELRGRIWTVLKHNLVTPGKGGAFNQLEMRDIRSGSKTNERLRTDETVERLRVEQKDYQYLFAEGDVLTFMDQETFDQITLPRELVGEPADFLKDGMIVTIDSIEGSPVSVHLPQTAVLKITEADAVVRGQTAASSYKPAILENGVRVMVPPFVSQGDSIVVNIEERAYVERAKD